MKIKESSRRVLVCQNRTCRKQGAAKVLAAFEKLSPSEVEVVASSCLGQCGNGPMPGGTHLIEHCSPVVSIF